MSVGVRVICYKGKAEPTFAQASETKSTDRLADLSPEYVSSLSQDISSRIKQRDSFRANSEELAARARFGITPPSFMSGRWGFFVFFTLSICILECVLLQSRVHTRYLLDLNIGFSCTCQP